MSGWLVLLAAVASEPAALVGTDRPAYIAWLKSEALKAEPMYARAPACPEAQADLISWGPSDAFTLPKIREITPGPTVIEHVMVKGCGRAARQNLLVFPLKAGGWRAVSMLPGEGRADFDLQQSAVGFAITAAVAFPPALPCGQEEIQASLTFGPIRVTQATATTGGWAELWPIRVCGQDRPVRVTFTPNARGTSFAAVGAWTVTPAPAADGRPTPKP